jgi:hypothetical protein
MEGRKENKGKIGTDTLTHAPADAAIVAMELLLVNLRTRIEPAEQRRSGQGQGQGWGRRAGARRRWPRQTGPGGGRPRLMGPGLGAVVAWAGGGGRWHGRLQRDTRETVAAD